MLQIKPAKSINAIIRAPPSKSYTNRALMVAALASGKSVLENVLFSDYTKHMMNALKEFGIKIECRATTLTVYGNGGKLKAPSKPIYVGNAGTAMRFLTAFAALAKGKVIITGDKRMHERPIQDLLTALNQIGVNAFSQKGNGYPPVVVSGGFLYGGNVRILGEISSQFLSSLMMIGPYAKKGLTINVVGELTSKPYVDITMDVMRNFGAEVVNYEYMKFSIANKKYFQTNYFIDGDASSVSYFFAASAVSKGNVRVVGINPYSIQGDIRFADVLGKMGCSVKKGRDFIEVTGNEINGIAVDMNSMPDTVQTLAVVALFAKGRTKIFNVKNIRVKETDRIKALASELRKLGARVEEIDDGLIITPGKNKGAIIETYNDHRMAMSFAVAGLRIPNVKIKNPECVSKSFPDFWERFKGLYR